MGFRPGRRRCCGGKVLTRSSFAYLNARVRARRGQLLGESFFRQAQALSFSEFLRLLAETPYGAELVGEGLADVDRAVALHLAHTIGDLPSLVSGPLRELVRLPLLRADLVNLKTILRGKEAGKSPEEIRALLLGGTLPEPLLNAMLQAPDAQSVAQLLQLPGHPLARALRIASASTSDLLRLEVVLDREFFAACLKVARKLRQSRLVSYYELEVDATNLTTAYKLQALGASGVNPEDYFIPGGRWLSRAVFSRLVAGDLSAAEALGGTPLASAVGAADLGELERALRKVLLAKARAGASDSLGGGLLLDYVLRKQWEASRIRLLARRAYFNLPVEAVAKEVT